MSETESKNTARIDCGTGSLFWRGAIFLVVAFAAANSLRAADDSSDKVFQRLNEIWTRQEREVQSAEMEAYIFRYGGPEGALSVDDLERFAAPFVEAGGADFTRAQLTKSTDALRLGKEARWCTVKIHVDGYNIANAWHPWESADREDGVLNAHDVYFNGVGVSLLPDSTQIDIRPLPVFACLSPAQLRRSPTEMGAASVSSIENGTVHLANDDQTEAAIEVSEQTGLLTHYHSSEPDGWFRAVRQWDPVEFPGGILFPRINLCIFGRGSEVTAFFLVLVREAEFNVPIDPNVFVVAAKPGVVVADYRAGAELPKTIRATHAVDNAIEVADNPSLHTVPIVAPPAPSDQWYLVIIANIVGILLIGGGFALMRRRTVRA